MENRDRSALIKYNEKLVDIRHILLSLGRNNLGQIVGQ